MEASLKSSVTQLISPSPVYAYPSVISSIELVHLSSYAAHYTYFVLTTTTLSLHPIHHVASLGPLRSWVCGLLPELLWLSSGSFFHSSPPPPRRSCCSNLRKVLPLRSVLPVACPMCYATPSIKNYGNSLVARTHRNILSNNLLQQGH